MKNPETPAEWRKSGTMEKTDQGWQRVIPGAERDAHQAVAARGEKMRHRKPQRAPGGLFAEKPAIQGELGL